MTATKYVIPTNNDAVSETVWQQGSVTIKLMGHNRESARYVVYVGFRIASYKSLDRAVRRAELELAR